MENHPPRESFAQVPLALLIDPAVSDKAARVYALICTVKPDPDGGRYVHNKTLAAALGIKERNIQRQTAQLCAAGWLAKTGDGGCNRPARYLPFKVKTMTLDDMVSGQNHVIQRHGQVVDTADSVSMAEVRGNATRARGTTPLTAGTPAGKKEFLKLHVGFIPPCGWEPILVKARQARLEAGLGPLPIRDDFLIEKFLQRKAGKELTLDVIESDLIEWYCREKPPRKTGGTPRPATPAAAPVLPKVPPPTAAPPPDGAIKNLMALLAENKSLNQSNARPLPQAAPCAVSPEVKVKLDPKRRAEWAAEHQEKLGCPLPANCHVIGV